MFLWHKFATSIYKESIYFYVQRTLQNKFLYIFHFSNSKKNLYGNTKITDLQKRLVCCLFVSCSCYCENWWKLDDHKQQHPGVYTYSDVSLVILFSFLITSSDMISTVYSIWNMKYKFNMTPSWSFKTLFLKSSYLLQVARWLSIPSPFCRSLHFQTHANALPFQRNNF